MKKAQFTAKVDLTPEEVWEIFEQVEYYPFRVPFMKSSEIDRKLAKGVVWYDVTSILYFPIRVQHLVDIFEKNKQLGFECELPANGKMYQRFMINSDKRASIVTGEISFDLGSRLATNIVGPYLTWRLQKMLKGMIKSLQKEAKRNKKKDHPFVSVVIPAYNEEKLLGKTLKNLTKQSYTHYEVIVADNGSTDKTAQIARDHGAKVVTVRSKGVGIARNEGFMAAKGEIIASTDADTLVPPYWLLRIVNRFKDNSELVALGGYSTLYSGPWTAKATIKYLSYPFMLFDRIMSGGWNLIGFNMAIQKKAFLATGGFDTSLKIGEDIDISEKLRRIGKVEIDRQLTVQVSGRRYEEGYIRGIMDYAPHFLSRVFLRKVMVNSFRDVR